MRGDSMSGLTMEKLLKAKEFFDKEPPEIKMISTTKVTLKYNDKQYVFDYNYGNMVEDSVANYMWYEGNYACDCNLSLFIQRHCDKKFPEMKCGDKIELISVRHI